MANLLLKRIKDWATSITAFRTGDVIPMDGPSGTAKMLKDDLLKVTAQNALAGNVAQAFDPTRTSTNPYAAGESVAYAGAIWVFKVPHYGPWAAGDVDRVVLGSGFIYQVTNPEYIYAIVDSSNKFLFGIKNDGGIEWAVGVPLVVRRCVEDALGNIKEYTDEKLQEILASLADKVDKEAGKSLINSTFADGVSILENPEYLYAITDSSNNLLLGIRKDGDVVFGVGVPSYLKFYIKNFTADKVDKEPGKSIIDETFAAGVSIVQSPEYLNAIVDALNRVILGVKEDGSFVFKAPVSFDNIKWSQNNLYQLGTALKELGLIRGVGDQSEKSSLHIPMPKFCVINFSNILRMPLTKTEDAQAIMEFWDNSGNYFKKNVIANAQGNSSLVFVKKNVSFDLCNDNWLGDDTFKIKFGEWVEQDSFHLKAYYTDFFRGLAIPAYNFYKEILDTHGNDSDRTWKLALNIDPNNYGQGLGYGESSSVHDRLDNGALCFPQGFPALVYLNGEFYGIFSWNLKKHRDNYHMDKSNENHIHLDGIIGADFFSGNIDWTDFEVRNPKKLICMDGSDYDGDNPAELIDSSSESYNPNNSKHVFTASVKAKIVALSGRLAEISAAATTEDKKTLFEKYFCSGNLIDYQIFSDVLRNTDGFNKNWQWTTWDGERWFVNAYDLDETFGSHNTGIVIFEPLTSRLGSSSSLPSGVMQSLYSTELDARYAELRASGIIDSKRLSDSISSWCKTVGEKFYKLEFEKWNDSPCNRDMVVAEEWEVVLGDDGKPDISYSGSGEYSPSRTYNVGDVVKFNATSVRWWYQFRCVAQVQGVQPITKFGQRDNLWRVQNWLRISIENMDSVYNYNN